MLSQYVITVCYTIRYYIITWYEFKYHFSLPPLLRVVLLYLLYYSSTLTVNACQLLLFNPLRFHMAAAPSGWAL